MRLKSTALLLASLAWSGVHGHYRDIRAALMVNPDGIPLDEGFLNRVRDLGYNHVVVNADVGYWTSSWNGTGGVIGLGMQNQLQQWFQQVDDKGMRMIPLHAMGNRYSKSWKEANRNIVDNVWIDPDGNAVSANPHGPDAEFDKTFQNYLTVVKLAWDRVTKRAPGQPADIRYFLLGKDEIMSYHPSNELIPARTSARDQAWIDAKKAASPGMTKQWYFQALMADELLRRIQQVKGVFPNAQVLAFGCMWDDQYNGGEWFKLADGTAIQTGGALDLPGLDASQQAYVKANVIFLPWRYDTWWEGAALEQDWLKGFQRFHDKGFMFMAVPSVQEISTALPYDRNWADLNTVMRWVRTGGLQGKARGYLASPYPTRKYVLDPGAYTWNSLEVGARLGRPGRKLHFHRY